MIEINGTFIAVLINFIILLYVLNYFLYKPVMDMLDKRKALVDRTLSEADARMAAAKASVEEGLQVINTAHSDAKHITDDAAATAEKIRKDAEESMKSEMEDQRARLKEEIKLYRIEAAKEMRRDAAKLSVAIAEKIIKQKMNLKVHRALIDDFIESAGK